MYVDINSVEYNHDNNTVTIEATNLDTLLLNDWDQDISEQKASVKFLFDLTQSGPRIYLYKMIKSLCRDSKAKSLVEMLKELPNKTTSISNNFITK